MNKLLIAGMTAATLALTGTANAGTVQGALGHWGDAMISLPEKIAAKERQMDAQRIAIRKIQRSAGKDSVPFTSAATAYQVMANELQELLDRENKAWDRLIDCIERMSEADFAIFIEKAP